MEDNLIKRGKDICDMIEQLIGFDDNYFFDKMKFYCEHCLRFDKDKVNSTADNFYEECEEYLKELESWLNKSNINMRNMRLKKNIIPII